MQTAPCEHSTVRFRVQQLADGFWRERYLFCSQPSPGDPWQCRDVRRSQLDKQLRQLGFADHRDTHEIFSKLGFAVRHYGLANGYVQYDLDSEQQSPERFDGDPRAERS